MYYLYQLVIVYHLFAPTTIEFNPVFTNRDDIITQEDCLNELHQLENDPHIPLNLYCVPINRVRK